MTFLRILIDFVIPRFCFSCSLKLEPAEEYLCKECFASLTAPTQTRLLREFNRKFLNEKIISDFYSNFVFEKDGALQELIHKLKYGKRLKAGIFLGKQISPKGETKIKSWNADIILPIPLHPIKKAERGYNQSYYIAKGLGSKLNIPVRSNILKRNRYTETQTTLDISERKENISEAFEVKNKRIVKNSTVILVDDVITTGATVREAGIKLLNAGAKKVYAFSSAIAD